MPIYFQKKNYILVIISFSLDEQSVSFSKVKWSAIKQHFWTASQFVIDRAVSHTCVLSTILGAECKRVSFINCKANWTLSNRTDIVCRNSQLHKCKNPESRKMIRDQHSFYNTINLFMISQVAKFNHCIFFVHTVKEGTNSLQK